MKRQARVAAAISLSVILPVVLMSASCATPETGGFAVFLTKSDVPPSEMPALSHIELDGQPVISMRDIVAYNAQTHELKLSAGSFERINKLEIPIRGKSFVVCADRQPVYWGAFWTPISSISFDGVTIWKPYSPGQPRILTFELGYPSPDFYGGQDPRNSPELMKPLELAGKLIQRQTANSIICFPPSMKGYELYSWLQDGQWHFTLVTGTNRDKTVGEIISSEDYISEAGLVIVHSEGTDSLRALLSKMPRGEQIFWLTKPPSGIPAGALTFGLPSLQSVNNLREFAKQRGLDIIISQ
jgi:hypothetical protein